ncbi:MAG: hypothetical protein LBE11_03675 [Prevotellaceae bacterium]|jgi:hypothetical protein|nr:hypothetical protein [Prevotellaceae bacterium]
MKKILIILVVLIGLGISANAQISCITMNKSPYESAVHLYNSCNRSVVVSVCWTDAGGRAQSRNVTVPAWNERDNVKGYIAVNVGDNVTSVRIEDPRRVVPRR